MSLSVKCLVFNAFQVNTYLIIHDAGEALVVDPACYSVKEQDQLKSFITEHKLTIRYVINTHSHIDHILGNDCMFLHTGLKPQIHQEGMFLYETSDLFARSLGFEMVNPVVPERFLKDGDELILGEEMIRIEYTPGHANGSVCLISESSKWIITGDLLFYQSIGRTDLPTGNLETLLASIRRTVLSRPDDFVLYPGHGRPTTVGFERRNNPFL
jgi:hydroxyacylglutathione hydrolase